MENQQKGVMTDEHVRIITDYLRSTAKLMPVLSKSVQNRDITAELTTALESLEKRRKNLLDAITDHDTMKAAKNGARELIGPLEGGSDADDNEKISKKVSKEKSAE